MIAITAIISGDGSAALGGGFAIAFAIIGGGGGGALKRGAIHGGGIGGSGP